MAVTSAQQPTSEHTWHPQSLIALAQDPPAPPTIGGLLYPGKRTLLSGETESLKTWLALILAKAEMEAGHPVAWVDLDDMGAGAILQRLRALQVDDELTHGKFLYYQPDEPLYRLKTGQRTEAFADVLLHLTMSNPRLMVIDAFNPILTLHGLDPNSVTDIEAFWREIADPIAKTGACPCLLDHVVKNADQRGKYASGSERKASGATVHIGAHALEALTIGGSGRAVLTTHKDRPAYLPRPTVGVLRLESIDHDNGEQIQYTMQADIAHATGKFRPTILMEKISHALHGLEEAVPKSWVRSNVKGDNDAKEKALDALVDGGYVERTAGARNSLLHTLLKPYSQADDPLLTGDSNDLAATSLHPAVSLVSTHLATSLLPSRGQRGQRGRDSDPARSSANGHAGELDPAYIAWLESIDHDSAEEAF